MKNDDVVLYPSDYEACGDCGYDHGYEQEEARRWHATNDRKQEVTPQLQEYPPEVIQKILGG